MSRIPRLYFANQIRSMNLKSKSRLEVQQRQRKNMGLVGKAILAGAMVGVSYGVYNYQKRKRLASMPPSGDDFLLNEKPHIFKISRKVTGVGDDLRLTLYQYQTCPFCCKVRAFLDYHGLSYDLIEVNPLLRQQIKWSKYSKVPIVVAEVKNGYQQLNDSSMIVSALTSHLHDRRESLDSIVRYYSSLTYTDDRGNRRTDIMNKYFLMYGERPPNRTKESIVNEQKWRRWVDDVLVHTLSPNVYRTPSEALQAFTWFSETGDWEQHFSKWERYLVIYLGSIAMYFIGKILQKRHNLNTDVRISLYNECNHWAIELEKLKMDYMGGKAPNLADLAMYGALSSIEGCEAFSSLEEHSKIMPWFHRMKQAVSTHAGASPPH